MDSRMYPQGSGCIHSKYVDGVLNFYDSSGTLLWSMDPANKSFTIQSGSTLEIASGATATIADKSLAAGDIALTTGSILIGASGAASALDMKADGAILVGNGTTAAAKTTSGDAKIANDGSITIQAKAVEASMVALTAGKVLAGTKTTNAASEIDISAEGSLVIGQGSGETPAAAALSGDVKMDKTGATTIQAKAVENTMIAAAAGTVLVGTKTSGDVTALDISAAGAMALGQGAGETPAAAAMSGDVTMTKAGVTTIGAAKVTSAMLASGAGLAAVLTAGLGNSVSYVKTDDGTKTILAANATNDRGVLVVAVVDEAFTDGDGAQPTIAIGETDTTSKGMADTVLKDASAGAVFCAGFLNTSTKAIIATVAKATGSSSTGAASFAVLALPNS